MKYRILLRRDRYRQYQVVLQRRFIVWYGQSFYRRNNWFDAIRMATTLAKKFKAEILDLTK